MRALLLLLLAQTAFATPLHFASDSIDVNSIYNNPAGNLIVDTVNRALYNYNGVTNRRVLEWGVQHFSDPTQVLSGDWNARILYDIVANSSLDWTNRSLISGGHTLLSWSSNVSIRDSTGSNQLTFSTTGVNYPNLTPSTLLAINGSNDTVSASVSSPLTFSASALGCQSASGSQAGCLASADWTTFNNKAPTSAPTFSTSANFSYATISTPAVFDGSKNLISGSVSAPITLTSGAFGCQASSGSQAGCLSSADWTTFNGKQGVATVNTISSNTTLACNTINFIDTTSARSETFPSPSSGCVIEIKDKNFNANTNNITFVRAASEKIENVAASYVFSSNGGAIKWVSNGVDWFRL